MWWRSDIKDCTCSRRKCFACVDALLVVSPAMQDVVIGLRVKSERINLILNYLTRTISSEDKTNARRKFDWAADYFVVILKSSRIESLVAKYK